MKEIALLLDKSGSMIGLQKTTVKAVNNFICEQKSIHTKQRLSLIQFNEKQSWTYEHQKLKDIPTFEHKDYQPSGLTAIYDTLGEVIKKYKNNNTEVTIVLLTDGYENASQKFTAKKIRKNIKQLEKQKKWKFIYLGADSSTFLDTEILGISKQNTIQIEACEKGIPMAFSVIQKMISEI
tara:strand:+ start:10778 stop:11317 length:540 start_codon:yes stop_codon:yes gene_type:complete